MQCSLFNIYAKNGMDLYNEKAQGCELSELDSEFRFVMYWIVCVKRKCNKIHF